MLIFCDTKTELNSQHDKSWMVHFAIYLIKEECCEYHLEMVFLVQDIIKDYCKYWKINKQIKLWSDFRRKRTP